MPWFYVALVIVSNAIIFISSGIANAAEFEVRRYFGICDASAGVALDNKDFIVADDEHNILRIYRRDETERKTTTIDLGPLLGTEADDESDIEGAARLGDNIYWITSHARNKSAEVKKKRLRFFATAIGQSAGGVTITPTGTAYRGLLDDIIGAPQLSGLKLDMASKLAAEADGGLSIEGLAATPSGELLVGFRNPLHDGKALLVPLRNPAEVIEGKKAEIGNPVMLDLGGRAVRSIERIGDQYLIVAGPTAETGTFAVFSWSGVIEQAPVQVETPDFTGFHPEAVFAWPDGSVSFLSDDGSEIIDGKECKDIENIDQRTFRAVEPK